MSNVTIPVDIEDIKSAISNYNKIYYYVSQQANNKLKEYKETIIKRKLFGFIPWFNTTQYNKLGFNGDKYTRSFAIYDFKAAIKAIVSDTIKNQPDKTKATDVVADYFSYRYEIDKYRRNQYYIFAELEYTINEVCYGYNRYTPTTLNVSQFAYDFINKYKDVNLSGLK